MGMFTLRNALHMIIKDGQFTMMHVRRGGSNGAPKDKDERFVPVHPIV